jgi:hypothetical protein
MRALLQRIAISIPSPDRWLGCLLAGALLFAAPASSWGDVVYLESGGKMEGRIVSQTETSIEVDIGAGRMTFPMSSVDRIETGRSPLDDYDERAAALGPNDVDGWLELARWASGQGLGTQSRRAYERVLAVDPQNPEANRALGFVQLDGQWVTEEESYRARGYVLFEGEWMTPAEQDAVIRSREAEREAAQARAQAAQAQARQAEAEARQAEAEARQPTVYQYPVYWGTWGPGPGVWHSNPVDRGGARVSVSTRTP